MVGKILVLVFLGFFLEGNLSDTYKLMRFGRGQYKRVLATIVSANEPTTVGARQEFRVRTVLDYYNTSLAMTGHSKNVTVIPLDDFQGGRELAPYNWAITTYEEGPPAESACRIFEEVNSAPLSGFTWLLWRCKQSA